MKLSTRSRYGLKAVVDIAAFGNDKCVSINSVASRIGVSENYLEQLIIKLKKSGILKSVRGAQGGYTLGMDATDITVGRILNILEGPLYPVDCLDRNSSCGEGSCKPCVTRPVWEKIYLSITDVVDSITIADLVKDYDAELTS
ncbi:MAG: Rrf2 family transcriptional regulator [Clostridiales bacterium]|jgi:Rrf2 family protein|nr:Rrf2 family transcriptional regulator [Clostridiales bacterium]